MVTSEFDENVANNKFPPLGSPDAPIDRAEPADENPKVAAGYTYLGQFIDHDITFDPTSSLQRLNDPDALEDFRTPRLDLDCLYGRGPGDQPYLYDRASGRGKFILGGTNLGVGGMDRRDLHRTADGTALIGDKRNDENKIVAQIQALFLSFHNKVYDQIASRFESGQQDAHFAETQRIVRWCYQWIVLHDFLPKICDPAIVAEVMPADDEREPQLQYYHPHGGDAYIPVEFSVAAYRFGHSMVRPSYALNDVAKSSAKFKGKDFGRIPIFVANSNANTDAMNGFGQPLPADWGIDWAFFFGTPGSHADGQKQIPQPSYRIDSFLVDPLGALPEFFGQPSPFASLAFRNLQRGVSMGLPSGQNVARMMGAQFVLSDKQLWEVKNEEESLMPWDEGKAFFNQKEAKGVLAGNAPLWFYILKEAEIMNHGHHLGEVGSRIVAETLVGLTWCDRYSYMFQMPRWNPSVELIGLGSDLNMLELTQFVG
nr:heme peroxidase family protein [uncultured Roseateles sp.]